MWELNWLIRTRNNAIDREGTCDSSMMLLVVSNPRLCMLWPSGRLTKIFAHGWIDIIQIMLEALRLGYNPKVKANSCAVLTNAALISSRRRPAFSLILYSSWRLLIVGYEWRGNERARNGLIVWYLISILNYISYSLTNLECKAWLSSCSMRPPGPFVVIAAFVVRWGKPADVFPVVISAISIDVVTLASIPIQLVSVSREAH